MTLLGKAIFLIAFLSLLVFAGYTSENLKGYIPDIDRVILISGFIAGSFFVTSRLVSLAEREIQKRKR